MKRMKPFHCLDFDDLQDLEIGDASTSKNFRASTPDAIEDDLSTASISSDSEIHFEDVEDDDGAVEEFPADIEKEEAIRCTVFNNISSETLDDDSDQTPLWQALSDESSKLSADDAELLLVALQCFGRLPDSMMALITMAIAAFLPVKNQLKPFGLILSDTLGKSALAFGVPIIRYFCTSCTSALSALFSTCNGSTCALSRVKQHTGAYVCFPIREQLEVILKSRFHDIQRYLCDSAFKRDEGIYGDVITGKSYAAYGPNPDADGVYHISLIMSADGAAAFKCSSSSLWPCDGLIVELPPKQRCKYENAINFGFWIGRHDAKKPQWEMFMPEIISELKFLSNVGFLLEIDGHQLRFKVRIHATIFDSPALASFWSIKQYNGAYGCVRCQHPGGQLNRAPHYPKLDNIPKKDRQFYEDAWTLLDEGGRHVCVHSRSPFSEICNPATHHVIDPMHMIYLGNARAIFYKLFIGKPGDPAVLKCFNKELWKMITKIRFPHDYSRKIPNLANIPTYKATELKNLLMYAIVPIVTDRLMATNADMWHWIAIFVEGIRTLSQPSCTDTDLQRASSLLNLWQALIPNFLGTAGETYNAHVVEHLVEQVRQFGCLWAVSEFPFESFNGLYTRMVKSGKGIVQQLARRVVLLKLASSWVRDQSKLTTPIAKLLRQMFPEKMHLYTNDKSFEFVDFGPKVSSKLRKSVQAYLGSPAANIRFALRAKVDGAMFHSDLYYKPSREPTASSLAVFRDEDLKSQIYGEIIVFILHDNQPFVAYKKFENEGTICDYVQPPNEKRMRRLYDSNDYGSFCVRVRRTESLYVCPLEDLVCKFILIPCGNFLYATQVLPYEHN